MREVRHSLQVNPRSGNHSPQILSEFLPHLVVCNKQLMRCRWWQQSHCNIIPAPLFITWQQSATNHHTRTFSILSTLTFKVSVEPQLSDVCIALLWLWYQELIWKVWQQHLGHLLITCIKHNNCLYMGESHWCLGNRFAEHQTKFADDTMVSVV